MKKDLNQYKPHVGAFNTIDVVGGEKRNNGGEYEFWTEYTPTEFTGWFHVFSRCSCDFDSCGTGYEGIQCISEADYTRLMEESNRIWEAGSQY